MRSVESDTANVPSVPSHRGRGESNAHKRLHVVHVIETLGSGGAERLLYTNLRHLDPARFQNTVVTVFSEGTHWTDPIRALGVPIHSLECGGPYDLVRAALKLTSFVRRSRADLLHTHLLQANLVGRLAGRLAGLPVISSVHSADYDPVVRETNEAVSAWKLLLIRYLDRWTSRFGCSRMVAVSKFVRESAHEHLCYPLDRIDLVYNPVDVNSIQALDVRTRVSLLNELGVPETSKVLLSVGRVAPEKGLIYAIQALPKVLCAYPDTRLLIAGSTIHRKYVSLLQREAASLGVAKHVHLLGPRRDVADLLRACDLFVFPSLYEGLPLGLVEAMAAGCACISTLSRPMPEVIEHGRNGWLVPARNREKLAEGICRLLKNDGLRTTLGRAASRDAVSRFHPREAVEQLSSIYCSSAQRGQ